ncbi:MAG: Arm DNA-binding domain-containing protein, partial [Thermoanaerobaculia bacterium]
MSYQSEQLKLLKKLQHSGELGLEQFKETKERLLTPYKGKDGRPKWRRCVVWDTELPGFGLRVTPDNVKTFILSYRSGGRKRLMKIARFGILTVDEARKKARRELAAVGDGADPLKVRQERRREDEETKTVAKLCDAFMERHSKLHNKSWKEDQRRISKYIKPTLGHLRLEDVTRERVGQFY